MDSAATSIKHESVESGELVIQDIMLDAPEGFEQDEWAKLTDGWHSEHEEIKYWLEQRGQASSRKGRPTNFQAGFKGELSNSTRAVQQRNKAAQRSLEDSALNKAGAADRGAKATLKKKFDADPNYIALSKAEKELLWKEKVEELDQKRFNGQQSLEWLQGKLYDTHRKWAYIRKTVDRRTHAKALERLNKNKKKVGSSGQYSQAHKRVYGVGGAINKIMRRIYQDGATKLKTDEIQDEDAQREWNEFVKSLSTEDLAMVVSEDWVKRDPTPPPEFTYQGEDIILEASRPYIMGDNDDECEEEVDDDSEAERWLEQQPNEYESDNEYLAIVDEDSELESESETEDSEIQAQNSEDEGSDIEMADLES